jgi:hypothetical protein
MRARDWFALSRCEIDVKSAQVLTITLSPQRKNATARRSPCQAREVIKIMKIAILAAVLSSSAFVFGCSGAANQANDTTSTTDQDLSVSAKLNGTFEEVGKDAADLGYYAYTFKSSNHTFKAVGGCRQDGPGVHCFAISEESGTWSVAKTSKGEELTLDTDGHKSTYFLSIGGNTLILSKLTNINASTNFYLESWAKKIPIMDICADENGKSLGECADDGNFACGDDGLNDGVQTCTPLDG